MESESSMTKSILFVCTGNVFRSMAAEYALRARQEKPSPYHAESAGIEAKPQKIHPVILNRLRLKGTEASAHAPRTLTKEVIQRSDLIIAMGLGHREFIQTKFGLTVPLFNEVALGKNEPILDLHEALPNWERDIVEAREYVESVIDHIWDSIPALLARLPQFSVHQHPRRT
jgi:protein-tyrosine phosphatase